MLRLSASNTQDKVKSRAVKSWDLSYGQVEVRFVATDIELETHKYVRMGESETNRAPISYKHNW